MAKLRKILDLFLTIITKNDFFKESISFLFLFTLTKNPMKKITLSLLCLVGVCLVYSSCFALEKSTIFVSILPQKFFVEKLIGNALTIEVMVPPGANPVTYEPKPSQMRALSKADAYFSIGVPFERSWLTKLMAMNSSMILVQTDNNIKKMMLPRGHSHNHDGHSHVEESGTNADPHIWLSPQLVIEQLATTKTALQKLFPQYTKRIEENHSIFLKEIAEVQRQIRQTLKGKKDYPFLVFHPSWGYFAKEFDLHQISVEIEGKEPKPSQLSQLIQICQQNEIHVIFAQPQFSTKSAQLIAREIKGKVLLIDPLKEDWLSNMLYVAKQFQHAVN